MTVYVVILSPAGFTTVTSKVPLSMGDWMGSRTRVDVVLEAAKLLWVMTMLSVLFINTCPSSIHVMLVSGKLNPVMSTIRVRLFPKIIFTVWSGGVMGIATRAE